MGAFKSLVDKARAKKDELEKKAAQKAAERAAELALERGKQAARAVVEQAGKSLKRAGASIEEALFGPESEAGVQRDAGEAKGRAEAKGGAPKREAKRPEQARAEGRERLEREVDEELAALKRKIAKKG